MFSDYFEKGLFKKTTKDEKKEVVKNAGTYFPANHSNKIKGMDELAEAVVNNAMKKQEEIVEGKPRKGYLFKDCEVCGKRFESYRGVGKYCKECGQKKDQEHKKEYAKKKGKEALFAKATAREKDNAHKRARSRGTSYDFELMKIMKGIDPLRSPNRTNIEDRDKRVRELNKKYRAEGKIVMTPVGEATLRERECASKRASIRGTGYLHELKRILDGTEPIHTKSGSRYDTAPENTPVGNTQEPVEKTNVDTDLAYLDSLMVAIDIVRTVKSTEDVEECIKKVCDIFRAQANKEN